MTRTLRIAIVAGEASGDILGSGLIRELKNQYAGAVDCYGIGGKRMIEEGFQTHADMQKLSIMGFDGLFENLRDILDIRKQLQQHIIADPPDVFIGIDVPDFNLTLEKNIRQHNIPTIHYVSPTVWAWREYRIHKIRKAVDLMLTLFPFEKQFYQKWQVPVEFVGHPLAKRLKPDFKLTDIGESLQQFKNDHSEKKVIAVLPGSRNSEIKTLATLFFDVIIDILQTHDDVIFAVPIASEKVGDKLESFLQDHPHEAKLRQVVHFFDGQHSADVLRVSDVALLASGTAALESALLAKPTVVAYKVSWLTYWFARLSAKVKYASMPNHLLDSPVVPEFLQNDATVENLSTALKAFLEGEELYQNTSNELSKIHAKLDEDADKNAALAVLDFIKAK